MATGLEKPRAGNLQRIASSGLDASRLLRRRTFQTRPRQASVTSLDQVFDTQQNGEYPQLPKPRPAQDDGVSLDTFGVSEMRDNFFDAYFSPPRPVDREELMEQAERTLPYAFRKKDPLSLTNFFPRQWHELKSLVRRITTTRAGIKLLKSFLAFFIAYVLCLVPAVRSWLGRYDYIMVISAIMNHSGRSLGAQVEGAIFTILGTATGLGWGALGLWLSTSSAAARTGFGGILALFLFIYIFLIACIRSYYIRTYQLVICAGIAISYTCLAEVSGDSVSWSKLLSYGLPWVIGQAIALVPCILVFPDAGARPLAVALHNAFEVMMVGYVTPYPGGRILKP